MGGAGRHDDRGVIRSGDRRRRTQEPARRRTVPDALEERAGVRAGERVLILRIGRLQGEFT